jgi:hypothetical protein
VEAADLRWIVPLGFAFVDQPVTRTPEDLE